MAYLSRDGQRWTRDETILALGLYFQLPWGRMHHRAQEIISLSQKMGRTPSSLAMKLTNIGRCDPTLSARGVAGLSNGGRVELDLWNEFVNQRELLSIEFDRCMQQVCGAHIEPVADELLKTPVGMEGVRLSRYRINQSFFRGSVLAAYNNSCCITGISEPKLLIASHIKPWVECENGNDKTNAQNGLCLNALHDRGFDRGLLTIDPDYRVVLSRSLKDALTSNTYCEYFKKYDGKRIRLPDRSKPSKDFVCYHNEHIFVA